ncbi:MAG: DUF29 domain-containing protein [Desmonostoc vinosum HA7617-LM4]|jgi:hypothetical protein|nr:DUF29 domain-containing protein [Desmonostoc vinosum HA7617-LM4]
MSDAKSYEQDFLLWTQKYYQRARRDAAKETQKPIEAFPSERPFTIEQVLNPEFFA